MTKGTLTIDGKEYKLSITLRTHVIYERITGKMVSDKMTTFENVVFIFSVLMSQNRDTFKMTFDEFFDYIDSNDQVYTDFFDWLAVQNKTDKLLNQDDDNGKKKV